MKIKLISLLIASSATFMGPAIAQQNSEPSSSGWVAPSDMKFSIKANGRPLIMEMNAEEINFFVRGAWSEKGIPVFNQSELSLQARYVAMVGEVFLNASDGCNKLELLSIRKIENEAARDPAATDPEMSEMWSIAACGVRKEIRIDGKYQKKYERLLETQADTVNFSEENRFDIRDLLFDAPGGQAGSGFSAVGAELAARQKSPGVMVKLGVAYESGEGVAANYEIAAELYRSAAILGDLDGAVNLGNLYFHGHGVVRDEIKAVRLFRLAVEKNHRRGQLLLGAAYDAGRGVGTDSVKAHSFYLLAAKQGDPNAQYNLGYNYTYGEGAKIDYVEALKWYRAAAAQRDSSACNSIGVAYKLGSGVKRDNAEALKWFLRADELGNSTATNHIGVAYEEGLGVKADAAKARIWYARGTKQGNGDSQGNLARLLAEGHGGAVDRLQAYELWKEMVDEKKGDILAINNAKKGLEELLQKMSEQELSYIRR